MVSKAREDLPLPLMPVMTTNLFLGIRMSIFFRLCTLAPNTSMDSSVCAGSFFIFSSEIIILLFLAIEWETKIRTKIWTGGSKQPTDYKQMKNRQRAAGFS